MKPKPAPRPEVSRRISWLFGIGGAVAAVAIVAGLAGSGGASPALAQGRRGSGPETTIEATTVSSASPTPGGGVNSHSLQEW